MNVRDEIKRYAKPEDKEMLLALFDRYHMQSQWNFVAFCTSEGQYPNSHRIWNPTYDGAVLYHHYKTKESK